MVAARRVAVCMPCSETESSGSHRRRNYRSKQKMPGSRKPKMGFMRGFGTVVAEEIRTLPEVVTMQIRLMVGIRLTYSICKLELDMKLR